MNHQNDDGQRSQGYVSANVDHDIYIYIYYFINVYYSTSLFSVPVEDQRMNACLLDPGGIEVSKFCFF